ncbi:UrvD/REP family ATP-dependent DNA helicase [Gryllotalpicola ginsengisoli]|uniref:UrvD/REP family ATP-dependent DNA helicase n=1 Tax=Gryllotalpicola ginsengisoli TaxID=444608 RepID=UPI001FE1D19B|nr:UrvD/REP family ATP-dependent DNA helicase [Gryllotalpicola ginsengisoli]
MDLDPSQQAVLDLPADASAAVLGAPGTGKTATVVELVADRVHRLGFDPDEVLVLCAGRSAATALRDRLSLRLGVATQGPRARTANSLAFGVLADRAAAAGAPEPRLLTGGEQDQIIADLIDGDAEEGRIPWPEQLPADVRRLSGFRAELRELMARMVEHAVTPERLQQLGREHDLPEWVAAGAFIREYQDAVDAFRDGYVTSAELLADAARLIAAGEVDPGIRLLVVDDVQEFTRAGLDLLAALARRGVTVVAFGDPDVATTTFRGADPEAVARLGERLGLGRLEPLVLRIAHRQPAALRRATAAVTARIGAALAGQQRQAAAPGEGGRLLRVVAGSASDEYATLARELREQHVFAGRPWSDMAVIVRSGAQVPAVARALGVGEVPTRTTAAGRALRDDYAAGHLIAAVGVVLGLRPLDGATAAELLLGPLGGLDAVALRRLRLALRHEELAGGGSRPGDELLAEALADPNALATIDMPPGHRARRLAQTLAVAREQAAKRATIEELLWTVWDRSRLADAWLAQTRRGGILADEANRDLDGVVALFTAAKRFVERDPERPAADFVTEVLGSAVPDDTLAPQAASDAVLVCTPSAAVGLEFGVVAVAALQEGTWPNIRLRGTLLRPQLVGELVAGSPHAEVDERQAVLHDELRMFALAVSRASDTLIVAAAEGEDDQPSALLGLVGGDEVPPARHPYTLRGLTGELRRRLASGDPRASGAAASLAQLAEAGVAGAHPDEWYGLLEPTTSEPLVDLNDPDAVVAVSPSKIEAFEKSPLQWFVDVMSGGGGGVATGVGTLLHAVMEAAGSEPDGDISVARIWGDVERRWGELNLEEGWVTEREKRRVRQMAEGVHEYLADFRRSGSVLLEAEGGFALRLGQVQLRGKIDRVERHPDGTIVIVDLKTGRRNPPAAEIPTHAQLSAYQLAYREGAISVDAPPEALGGAKLVFVAPEATTSRKRYRDVPQAPLDDEQAAAFRERVEAAGRGMAGAVFVGTRVTDGSGGGDYTYRIHLVPEVSA